MYGFIYFHKHLIFVVMLDAHMIQAPGVQAQWKQLLFYEGHSAPRLWFKLPSSSLPIFKKNI